jgi:hypothetical protein
VSQKYFNIPRLVCNLFCSTCSTCNSKKAAKLGSGSPVQEKTDAHAPAPVKRGKLGARGLVDLLDYQSSPHMGYVYLLTYVDDGRKIGFATPLPNKSVRNFSAFDYKNLTIQTHENIVSAITEV